MAISIQEEGNKVVRSTAEQERALVFPDCLADTGLYLAWSQLKFTHEVDINSNTAQVHKEKKLISASRKLKGGNQ
jgi:hypothetical protein